jgi:ADP-ribose pyrophosphatase YjhB (NUDIX family)
MSRLYPARPFLAASVAVFRAGRVLLGQRTGGAGAGLWSLPGGMVEVGETTAAAALRELKEETGVEAEIIALADVVDVILPDDAGKIRNHAVIAVYAGHWRAGEGETSAECGGILWADPAALGDLPMTAGLAEVVRKAAHLVGQGA